MPSIASLNGTRRFRPRANCTMRDDTDRLITEMLVEDGRSTLKSLADATGLSLSAVSARVHRLETDGVIQRYTAMIDPAAVGLPLAALVAVTPLDPCEQDDIPARIAGLSMVESCYAVAGDGAFVLFVRVSSPLALEELLQEIRRRANVSAHTTVVLRTFFERRAHPPL